MTTTRTGWAPVLAAVLLVAACGQGTDVSTGSGASGTRPAAPAPGGASSPSGSAAAGGSGAADLRIVVTRTESGGDRTTWRLTCDPPGGTHPDPRAACAALAAAGATALRPVPTDVACSQIYGGPEKAVVSGTWQGRRVDAQLSRVDGCQIGRWQALAGLLPAAGAT